MGGVTPPRHDVVSAVLVRDGKVFLVHRSPTKEWYPSVWDLPGGHVESGESAVEALTREMREELGVIVAPGAEPDARIRRPDMDLRLWVFHEWVGEPANVSPEEHDAVGWFTADETRSLELASEEYRAVFARLGAGLAK